MIYKYTEWVLFKDGQVSVKEKRVCVRPFGVTKKAIRVYWLDGCFPSRFFESREPFKMFRLGWVFDLFGLDRQNCAGEFIDTLYEVRSVGGNNVNRKA